MGRAFEFRRKSKEKRWDKMSKVFPRLAKAITMAAKEGGTDPEMNAKLRTAIMNAKAENLPKDNIEAAIKRASGKDAAEIVEIHYEAKGPLGTMFVIECASDNTNRTVVNLRTYFNKCGGQVVESGSLQHLFQRKAVVSFEITEGLDMDEVELGLIDHGLEELEKHEEEAVAYTDFKHFGALVHGAEQLGLKILKAEVRYVPVFPVELGEDQMTEIEVLLDKIEDDEDVQNVFTNIA